MRAHLAPFCLHRVPTVYPHCTPYHMHAWFSPYMCGLVPTAMPMCARAQVPTWHSNVCRHSRVPVPRGSAMGPPLLVSTYLKGSATAEVHCHMCSLPMSPAYQSTCSFSSISDQVLGLQGARCLAVFCPAFSPQNDLPVSTPASKSCDSSPPQDASTPGPSSASHLRQLAAKPTPSTDSIGECPQVPARAGLLSGREVLESGGE